MAKTNTKKGKAAPSLHSRAARRETSPSINTDKSLKDVQPPKESTLSQRPAILGLYQNAGVSKKTKKQGRKSVLSTRARRRHERGLERAEEILDRTAVKVSKSKQAAERVQGRRKGWEEINAAAEAEAAKKKRNMFAGLEDEGADEEDEEEWEDEKEGDDEMGDAVPESGVVSGTAVSAAVPTPAPPPPMEEDEDEIL